MYFAGQQTHSPRQSWLLRGACLALFMLISACGFTLRGVTPLPFDTLYVGIPDYTQFGADVRRALRAASPNTKLVATDVYKRQDSIRAGNRSSSSSSWWWIAAVWK